LGFIPDWTRHRKELTPAFHFFILEEFIPIIQENADVLIDVIKSANRSGGEAAALKIFELINELQKQLICNFCINHKGQFVIPLFLVPQRRYFAVLSIR
jgi:cytochrome P450